jgi:tRNA dimethylallyltransferase
LTGRPISAWQTQWSVAGRPLTGGPDAGATAERQGTTDPVLWLNPPRAELYARIDERVTRMFEAGLVDEVRALRRLPQPLSREASQALGYKEVIEQMEGRAGLEETVVRIQRRTRHFAKRQLSWFRHLPECRPVTGPLTFAAWGLRME